MRRYPLLVILGAVLALSVCSAAYASVAADSLRYPALRYTASPCAEWSGDSLVLRFTCRVEGRLKSSVSLHAVPLYIVDGDTLRYPSEGFCTTSGARYHRRRRVLAGNAEGMSRLHMAGRKSSGSLDYHEALVVPSFRPGKVCILHVLETCCDKTLLSCHEIAVPVRAVRLPSGMLPPPVAVVSVPLFGSNVTFIEPEEEPVKERTATATVRLTYPVDRWAVHPTLGDNASELERLHRLLSPVLSDTANYRLSGITVTGYASPEGTYTHNQELSDRRAAGILDYLKERYRLPGEVPVFPEGKGEDWEGLRAAVAESGMPYREEVLSIIDGYGIFEGREKRLMELRGGRPYRHMLDSLFPPLRRMVMRIDYTVRPFGLSEADSLIDVRSRDLSLREMYGVARVRNDDRTILRSRDSYGREYDIAVGYFPDDIAANINASSAALVRGDLKAAWLYLSRVRENPAAYNNLGVYHWICGRTEEAEAYFLEAAGKGSPEAAYNLGEFNRWKEGAGKNGNDGGKGKEHSE